MKCKDVEELISLYIEGELPEENEKEISLHLGQCPECVRLKETLEEILGVFPELEEDVPFYLKNRLYYIPESQQVIEMPESRFYYLKWVAAAIGTFVLLLNLFYFTNIYPAANRFLHTAVSKIETFTVETGAFFERLKESKDLMVFSFLKSDSDDDDDDDYKKSDRKAEKQSNTNNKKDPGKMDNEQGNTGIPKDTKKPVNKTMEQELLEQIRLDVKKVQDKKKQEKKNKEKKEKDNEVNKENKAIKDKNNTDNNKDIE